MSHHMIRIIEACSVVLSTVCVGLNITHDLEHKRNVGQDLQAAFQAQAAT